MNYYRFRVASYSGAARNISSSFNFVSRRSIDQRLSCRLRLRRRLDISLTKQDFPPICERGRFTSGPVPRARKMAAWKSAKLRNPPKLSLSLSFSMQFLSFQQAEEDEAELLLDFWRARFFGCLITSVRFLFCPPRSQSPFLRERRERNFFGC